MAGSWACCCNQVTPFPVVLYDAIRSCKAALYNSRHRSRAYLPPEGGGLRAGAVHQRGNEAYQVAGSRRPNEGTPRGKAVQNVSLTPSWAAKGMPTVVPGPKKSPRAPAGTRSWLALMTGVVWVQAGFKQKAVALLRSLTRVGRAEMSPT